MCYRARVVNERMAFLAGPSLFVRQLGARYAPRTPRGLFTTRDQSILSLSLSEFLRRNAYRDIVVVSVAPDSAYPRREITQIPSSRSRASVYFSFAVGGGIDFSTREEPRLSAGEIQLDARSQSR